MHHLALNRRQLISSFGASLLALKYRWDVVDGDLDGDAAVIGQDVHQAVPWEELARNGTIFEHWTPESNSDWQWYRLERYADDVWDTVGISLPEHKETGDPFEPAEGYIDAEQIPEHVLTGALPQLPEEMKRHLVESDFSLEDAAQRGPDPEVRSRDGRPPSEWLRSLHAQDLRTWLPTIEVNSADVRGMTFWVHLVRDHGFDPRHIDGLSEEEFRLLHSAAHDGY